MLTHVDGQPRPRDLDTFCELWECDPDKAMEVFSRIAAWGDVGDATGPLSPEASAYRDGRPRWQSPYGPAGRR